MTEAKDNHKQLEDSFSKEAVQNLKVVDGDGILHVMAVINANI